MSGGFFRGTSADQDTRFSNKQAKLLKSQKFAPELDHLVDMTKVKMDVIRPWIATRATELLGFEDEVLINFVYGLLDGKEVDGKQIQIQLTGFMEKNTGKFMKELWGLLLSAQNNISGVPQQFLDAKEEETRKKKAETDRIAQEIQKRKEREGRELEREKHSRMDGEADISRSVKGVSDSVPKHSVAKASSVQPEEEREVDGRHGPKARNGHSGSPHSNDYSPSSYRSTPSATRSSNKSISKSKSYSGEGEGHKSRSLSVSSQSQRRSVSPVRRYRSPVGSVSPVRRYRSPVRRSPSPERGYRSPSRRSISPHRRRSPRNTRSPRRRSPHIRRRSTSRSRRRSPSPFRQRSPHARRRSPLLRRRSPPLRRRSPSPLRRRSPSSLRRRSPIKIRRRSPSPLRRRSPIWYRSPSPLRRRSPPPRSPRPRRRSPLRSPKSHPGDSQISPCQRNRSRSPYRSRSPPRRTRRSLSREPDNRIDGIETGRHRDGPLSQRTREKRSPLGRASERELDDRRNLGYKASETLSQQKVQISLRSPQRDVRNQSDDRRRVPVVQPEKSPSQSPMHVHKVKPKINRRSSSLSKSPVRQPRERVLHYDSPETGREEEENPRAREASHHRTDSSRKRSKESSRDVGSKRSYANDINLELYSPDRAAVDKSPSARGHLMIMERKKDIGLSDMDLPERHVRPLSHSSEEREYGPRKTREERASLGTEYDRKLSVKQHSKDVSSEKQERNEQPSKSSHGDVCKVNDENQPLPRIDGYKYSHHETELAKRSKKIVDKKDQLDSNDSDSEDADASRYQKIQNTEKRKHKKSDKRKRDSDESSESDSQVDDRKEAKRRRKDEKRLRKEERRRRREEKHRRRLERRASKLKVKSMDTVTPPSDLEKNHNNADDSDGDAAVRKNSHPSDADETESEQKRLEIELRTKALESLRAKKAISH